MKIFKNSLVNEFENGKYIIVKIPRDSLQSMDDFSLASVLEEKNFRKGFWIVICILSLFLGVVLGSLLHPDIFHQVPDKAVWKSSNLISPDGK
jgi:hypothetical protein